MCKAVAGDGFLRNTRKPGAKHTQNATTETHLQWKVKVVAVQGRLYGALLPSHANSNFFPHTFNYLSILAHRQVLHQHLAFWLHNFYLVRIRE